MHQIERLLLLVLGLLPTLALADSNSDMAALTISAFPTQMMLSSDICLPSN
ncbi:TPA: hypothetical protein ACIBOF_003568 [Salmonella enterica subsp. diarizonae serovar 61:r:-]